MAKSLKKSTVFIADDHKIFRLGLAQIIESGSSFRLAGEAGDGQTAIRKMRELKPNIAVLDISMPGLNGLEVCKEAKKTGMKTSIIILSMHNDVGFVNEALEAGALGYVLKGNALDDLVTALKMVVRGKEYVTPALAKMLLEQRLKRQEYLKKFPTIKRLTETEQRVLKLISKEMTSKDMATELSISYRTVQKHRANICHKLGLQGWNALEQFAVENSANL
jgi:DNA-binding NarL/FixJ family response regulator